MKREKYDIVVIGSGIAGLSYAIRCSAFAKVLIVTKGHIGESNTMYAQGGIAAVLGDDDSVEQHIADTLIAGDGLCDRPAVELLTTNAKEAIDYLVQCQVNFNKNKKGMFDLHLEGGHSRPRIVHHADATGREVENSLVKVVRDHPNIAIKENHFAVDLWVADNQCRGVKIFDSDHRQFIMLEAKVTLLATGGAGQVFLKNTNPPVATGDGIAMAYRAGAEIMDIEFIQFHPTTLFSHERETFLITEAIRGFGATLKNKRGETFMDHIHPQHSLAPRDIVSRAIISEMERSGDDCVYLDLTSLNAQKIQSQFPTIYEHCKKSGLDITTEMIPVVPAAHYLCGGIRTDMTGRTSISHLYACGECACTGVQGANRLASNSLLEGLVFAKEAAVDTQRRFAAEKTNTWQEESDQSLLNFSVSTHHHTKDWKRRLQETMWQHCGIIRTESTLRNCLRDVEILLTEIKTNLTTYGFSVEVMECLNLAECSWLMITAARHRKESRGCHYRADYPEKAPTAVHSILSGSNRHFIDAIPSSGVSLIK